MTAGTPPRSIRVLVADDQSDVLEALRLLLKGEGFQIRTAQSPAGVIQEVEDGDFDVVLMDLNYTRDTTSGAEGLDLLSRIQALDRTLPIVVMTAWGSVDGAVEAMRQGARDYVEKPWENERLVTTLRTQAALGSALRESERLAGENQHLREREGLPRLIAGSRAMEPVLDIMERVAPSDANVLIRGEHGTGKEVVAQWLHAASKRSSKSLVAVNVGGFSQGVFESELFGTVRGAFTDAKKDRMGCFELADGSTLFLDEIANITLQQQAKLLRVLETGEVQRVGSSKVRRVDVRVLSATNAELEEAVPGGAFREDLLYRLNTVEIHLPPLRERREDLIPLALHFLKRAARRYDRSVEGLSSDAGEVILAHGWPGNVREMEHAMHRAVLMARGTEVTAADLMLRSRDDGDEPGYHGGLTLDEVERRHIEKALDRHGGNVSRAAEQLGLSRSALYRRLQRHDLSP